MTFTARDGVLTYWTLGPQTEPSVLQNGLSALGLAYAPEPRSWLMSLKAALGDVFDRPEDMIRPLRHKEVYGYTVVFEVKGEDQNEYHRRVNASVDSAGNTKVSYGSGAVADAIQVATNHYRRVLPAASVSDTLTKIIYHLGGISLKEHGGVYFVPQDNLGVWEKVMEVVANAAIRPTTNDISMIPLELNNMTLRDLSRQITREIQSAADNLRKDVAENELGDRALLNRATRALALKKRIEEYEGLLGTTLDTCRQHLSVAVQAFTVAKAITEDEDIYAGVFS